MKENTLSKLQEELEMAAKKLSALRSPVAQQAAKHEMKALLAELGMEMPDDCFEEFSDGIFGVYYSVEFDTADYDKLISDKDTSVTSIYSVTCRKVRDLSLFSHGGVQLQVRLTVRADLPEDDLLTLRQLGKVHTSVEPASVSESVACTI